MSIVVELHDMMCFDSPRGLMAYLGLIPSEHSSGGKEHRGEITKAGNGHVRRLLIEAAWHYRHRPGLRTLAKRREGQPQRVIAIADRAMHRLHRRFNRMLERGKARPKVVVAIAPELTPSSGPPCDPKSRSVFEIIGRLRNTPNLGVRSRRMKVGTIQRTRVAALRQGGLAAWTRALRPRYLSTENGHAALHQVLHRAKLQSAHIRVTRRRSVLPSPPTPAPQED